MVMQARGSAGWTLVEVLFVVTSVAIGLGLAVPSYQSAVERREAVSAAERFSDFAAHARQLAVTRNRVVTVAVDARAGHDWCLGANDASTACDCRAADGPSACRVGDAVLAFTASEAEGVALEAAGGETRWAIDPTTGYKQAGDLAADHRFRFTAGSGRVATQVEVAANGLATVCVPEGADAIGGVYRCARAPDQGDDGALTR